MKKEFTLRSIVIALLLLIAAMDLPAQVYRPPYQYSPYPGGVPGIYPPMPDRQPAKIQVELPEVEASISDSTPYEQQSLIYKLRIVSKGNLKTAIAELPEVLSTILRPIGEPVTETDESGDTIKFITSHYYLLMPLRPGIITIPPARVHGVGTRETPYEVTSGTPLVLDVQPAAAAAQPWLPLYDLYIDAHIIGPDNPAAGDPLTLKVEISATGATGSQIPSLASQLKSPDIHIYPGKSTTEGMISEDGKTLVGRRVENYTLVPQYGGWLQLPGASINWWNVQQHRPEVAALIVNQLNITGPKKPGRRAGKHQSGPIGSFVFWIPLLIGIAIALFGWMNALFGSGRIIGATRLSNLFRQILGDLYAPVAAVAIRFSPRRYFHRFRTWIGRNLPRSWKLWFCLRSVERENDAEEWAHALQILSVKHLGVRPHAHLRELGVSIAAYHPGADSDKVDQLMKELDADVYGKVPIVSFSRWKREFRSQIAPSLIPVRLRGRKQGRNQQQLPALNPSDSSSRI